MPQTLLALLALALASLLTFNQQRLTVRSQQGMVGNEIELAAAGLASEVLELIGARSFDEETTPERIAAASGVIPYSPSGFSDASSFGVAGGCDYLVPANTPACDDVDDVGGSDWTPVAVGLARGRSLEFDIRTDVFYVASTTSMEPADAPTRHKRVILDVRSPYVTTGTGEVLRVTRVFSYDPVKAEMDYENSDSYISGDTTDEDPGSSPTDEGGY
jgi:hypothetical protein